MSKEIVKAIFDENIAGVREDLTFDAYFDSIKGNEEYKKGLFENYVSDGTKSYEEFNAETFGMGKPEAPSEVGGAESSPTGLGLSESEVGPPAGGTPPGAEPVGAPVSDAIEPIEPGEPEAPAVTVGLEEFNVIDNKKDRGFLETIFGWLGGEKTFERVESKFEDLTPSRQRLFQKGASKQLSEQIGGVFTEAEKSNEPEKIIGLAAKGYLSTNTFADYLAGDFASDKVAAEEINTFLEKGVEGQSETFKRFKGSIDPVIAEQSNEIKETMLKDRDYIGLTKEIDREFASQRAEVDAKYIGVIDAEKQAKLNEATVGLLAEYDAAMLSLPTESDVTTKKNEMLTRYQLLFNDGKMDADTANAELQKEYNSYDEGIKVKADEIVSAYNSGLEKAAEKIKSGLKDSEEYKQYISELTELRNGIVSSREEDLRGIQTRIQGDLAPKYNEKINSAIKGASSGPTPLLEKSGLLPTIQKVLNNKGFDLLPFDQKKSFLDRAFGNVVVQLREKGVAINDGTIAQARNEFDDAIMSKAYFTQKGTPSLYMLKTRAIEEAEKLDEVIASTKAKTGTKTFTSGVYASEFGQQGKGYDDKGLDQLLLAREKLQEIIDLPENMSNNEFTNFWNGLSSGQFVDYLPFVSGLKNLSGSLALYRSLEDDTPASRYLQNAVALGNSYKGVYEANNMASDWYKAGAATAESLPFMGEFVFTAGMGSLARKSTEKVVAKLLGEAAEKTIASKGMRVLAGTVVGALAQTTANPQRYLDETIKRMTPQMSIAFSEEGDDLVAVLDESTAEGGFEAFLKGYGVTASEYFSENLGFAGARALKYAGSKMMQNEFLKRAYIGWSMSKLNIDMPTAFKRLAEKGGWNGFFAEFGEELANMPLTNLITGDADVMAGILTESGDLDIENLMEVGRALVPISAAGVGANVMGIAVKSMTPENVTISYRDINNLPATETIDRGVWEKVTEALKSPDKLREFISNELPRLKVEGKAREIITRELESGLSRFEGGVVESTKPPQAKGAAETQPAEAQPTPKVSVQMKERKKLSADKKRLVGTGKFDFVVTIDGKEQNISRAEYNEYKRSGKLHEGIGADVLGEVDKVEGAVVESTKDAESIKTSLEGVEVPAELGTIENVAEVYEQAKGKEQLTDAEVAVVDFVEGNVAKVEGVSEGVSEGAVEATPEAETAVSPLQDVESTTKALEGVEEFAIKEIIDKFAYEKQGSKSADIGRSDSNDSKGQVEKGGQGDVGSRTPTSEVAYGTPITREEFGRNYENYDPRKLPSGDKIIGFHSGTTDVNSFEGYTPDDLTQQFGYILGASPSEASSFALRESPGNKPRFIYETEITNGDFLSHENPPTKEQLKKIGIVNGVDFTSWNGEGSVFDAIAKTFYGDWNTVEWRNKKEFYRRYNGGKIAAAKLLKEKGFIGNKWEDVGGGAQYEVYDPSNIKIKNKYQIYNSTAELISDQYHKAKADNSNPELVKAVEDLLGVTPEAVTPEVSGVAEVAEGQKQPSRVATFFSGAGTMEASLPNAQSVMAVEFNPEYVEAYNKAFGVEYEAKDVRDINPNEVIASKPDIFHASPVCKNFSAAKNKRTVLKSDMESADAVAKVIREAQPPIVTIENVPDYQGTVPFETIIKALEDAGYTFDVGVYNSADFGGVQNRERLLIRAVKSGELPPIQEKTAPRDWYSAIEDLVESAPDSKFDSRSESENWEMARIKDMVRKGKLDPSKPIITMGGSASRGLAAAANAGGPAPTLLSTSRSVPRIILPDGTVKRVTPEMMRRLMGLPESYPIPSNPRIAKEVLGNGVDGAFTKALIDPLLNRAETQPSAETPTQPLTLKEKAKEAKQKADEAAEKIKRLLGGRNGGLGISPFGRAKRLAEIDAQTLIQVKNYIYYKTLQGVYTFKDFVKDMKENGKRMFGVEISVVDSDKAIFDSAASRFEIDDAFARDILDLKDDFLFSIAAMSGRINMNFLEFISSNQAVVDQFVQNAQTNYGLNENQAMMLVKDMYQDTLQAAANRSQLYTTIDQVKDFNKNKEELLAQELEMQKARINEEIKRRRNFLSRNYENFKKAFISPVKNFNRVFGYKGGGLMNYRTSQEREVYSARKFRMGASTKAANWYNEVHKMIYGGLNYYELERLNKYLIYRRIVDVAEMRNQRAIEHENLKKELAAGATPVRKQQIKEEMAALEKSGIDEVKSGSIMVNGKKERYTTDLARAFVNDIDGRTDAEATKIKERAEMYTKANNELLKMRLDAGLISQEAYDSMEKRDYVRRMFIDLSNTSIDEVSYPSVSKEIKAIKQGSEDKILEMDTQTLLQINSQITFDAVAKNNFMNKAVDWAQNKQQGYLAEAIKKAENVRKKRARYLGSTAQNLTPDEIDKLTKEQTLFIVLGNNDKAPSGFTPMKYFVNGIEKNIAVRNDMVDLFQTPSGRGVSENSLGVKVLSNLLLTPLIKSSAVFLNPAFAIGNFALDVIHASMVTMDLYKSFSANIATILIRATGYTAENIYRKAVKYGASFFGQTARDSKFENLVKDYFEHGGGMSGLSNPTSRMYSDKLSKTALSQSFGDAKDGIVAVLDVINSLQSGSELITRVIIYEAALEKNIAAYKDKHGVDPTGYELTLMKISAAASAADLIDFREGTSATKVLDQTMLPFLNAMIQGAKAEVDFASKNPLLAAARLAEFGGMALGVALYNVKSGDDDEKDGIIGYNGVSEYIKANYFVMMMPWTKVNERGEVVRPFLSIKLPAALKATNILVSGMVSDQGSANTIGQVVSALEGGYVPEIGSIPPLGQITMALTANKDAFRKGAPVYRGRPDVLLTERFNAGETKAIYRDLFGAAYDLMNEDGENKGVLGFNEAGPAQWQAAFEKAISPNNPYYLGVTSIYAGFSSLYGKENQKEVDVLMDEKFSALNAFRSRVYREPQSGIQAKNIEDRKKIDFLSDQIGSWKKKNDDAIEFAAKQLRDISKLDAKEKQNKIDRFFDADVFDFISDAQMAKSVRAQGIKEIPENMDKIKDFIRDEESRLSLKLLEEFKPNFVFKHPSLKRYALSKDSYLELNEDLISGIGKEYDLSRDRKAYLIALKFVAGDDYKDIVAQIGAHQRDLSIVEGIQNDKNAIKYKRSYFRPDDRSSKKVSSESAINNLILLKYLLENE